MQKDAIQHIEQNAVAAGLAAYLRDISLPVMPLPANYSLASLEKYMDAPARFRGTFSTNYVTEFARYVQQNAVHAGSQVCIDAENMNATAILDLGLPSAPLHGDHRATVQLIRLNAYKSLRSFESMKKSQRDLAEWMEDWRDYLDAYPDLEEGTQKIDFKSAITAVRTLTLKATAEREHITHDLKASKSTLESIEASSKGLALPGFLCFTCKPYEDIKQRTFACRLSVITDEKPMFVLRVIQLDAHIEEMGKEFQLLVQDQLKDAPVSVRLGEFGAE